MLFTFLQNLQKNTSTSRPVWLTAQMHQSLFERLQLLQDSVLPLEPIQTLTNVSRQHIKINRHNLKNYIYNHPGYFFDKPSFLQLIKNLYDSGDLHTNTLSQLLPEDIPLDSFFNNPRLRHFSKFNQLFSQDGLKESRINLEELIKLTDECVLDGPNLYVQTNEKLLTFLQNALTK